MTLDIRANIACDLGTVISGGFSDDHIQGTGVVRTRGELVLDGLITARPGDVVRLAYERGGHVARFPRALRVLSSFADPFRRQTTMSIGCKLTMLEQLRENRVTNPAEDPANSGLDCTEFGTRPVNITFAYIASVCLQRLGIALAPGLSLAALLPGSMAKGNFDFSAGYVSILSDLLYSFSLVGYLDVDEQLRIRNLATLSGVSGVITDNNVIDISPIRSGDLPADTVIVSYNYNRFKQPDPELSEEQHKKRDWELDEVQGELENVYIGYDGGNQVYSASYYPLTRTETKYDKFDRVLSRTTATTHLAEKENSAYIASLLDDQGDLSGAVTGEYTQQTTEQLQYAYPEELLLTPPSDLAPCTYWFIVGSHKEFNDERDNAPVARVITRHEADMSMLGRVNLPSYVFNDGSVLHPGLAANPVEVQRIKYEQDKESGISKTITERQLAYGYTQQGQQGLAKMMDTVESANAALAVGSYARELTGVGCSIETHTDRFFGAQKRPGTADRLKTQYAKDPRVNESKLTFVQGSQGVGITTTYSMPFAPDDEVQGSEGTSWLVSGSRAEAMAVKFGRVQQRLAYGHRQGFSAQLTPDKLPAYPASELSLQFGVVLGQYMVNGQSWSFDSNGIVCNADLLYMGGVGTTNTEYRTPAPWSPVQDGISQLPVAPEIQSNPTPAPANSIPTPEGFDATTPGDIWDELPTNTETVHALETGVTAVIPPYAEEVEYAFPLKVALGVRRTLISIPKERSAVAVVKTKVTAQRVYPTATFVARVRIALTAVAVVSFNAAEGNVLPLLGSGITASASSGWTTVFSGNSDNTPIASGIFPFTIVYNNSTYNSCSISPNGYITFGGSSTAATGLSATTPALDKIFLNSGDYSIQRVYARSTTFTYRLRVEGTTTANGTGTSYRVYELAFFDPAVTSDYFAAELRIGASPINTGLFGAYSATASLEAYGNDGPMADTCYIVAAQDLQATNIATISGFNVTPVE